MQVWNWMEGKKTYIVVIVMAVLNVLVATNAITPDHLAQINAVLVALGFGALRAAKK